MSDLHCVLAFSCAAPIAQGFLDLVPTYLDPSGSATFGMRMGIGDGCLDASTVTAHAVLHTRLLLPTLRVVALAAAAQPSRHASSTMLASFLLRSNDRGSRPVCRTAKSPPMH